MKRIFLYLLSLILFSFSCSKTELVLPDQRQEDVKTEESAERADRLSEMLAIVQKPQRTKNEVLALAQQLLGSHCVRGGNAVDSQFEIDCVVAEHSAKLRGVKNDSFALVDTLLYFINKRDNGGFLIVSGDKRVPDVLAYSDNGNFDKENIPEGSGLALFLTRLPSFFDQTISEFQNELDILRLPREDDKPILYPDDGYEPEFFYSDWEKVDGVDNLVPVDWHQSYPFNADALVVDKTRAAAGCVATAVAQTMAAHRYPSLYAGTHLDWNFLTKFPEFEDYKIDEQERFKNQVAPFFRIIGDGVHNSWGVAGTGAYNKDIPALLRDMGYTNPSSETSYNYDGIIASIERRCPVIMGGYADRKFYKHKILGIVFKTDVIYSKGHAWVCDGYIKEERQVDVVEYVRDSYGRIRAERRPVGTQSRTLLHCNWGWGRRYNGFYHPRVFDSGRPVYGKSNDNLYYFRYELTNILDIHP